MRIFLLTAVIGIACMGCSQGTAPEEVVSTDIVTEWTDESSCATDTDCEAIEYGCGGNHTTCTSEPEKYADLMSSCEIVQNHPNEQGYACGCSETKCVWKK